MVIARYSITVFFKLELGRSGSGLAVPHFFGLLYPHQERR